MCVASTVIAIGAIVSAAAAVGGAVVSAQQGQAAAAKQREAARVQAAQNAINSANAARQQVRDETVRRAQILQASQDTGTQGSSGSLGAVSSLGSQVGNSLAEGSGMLGSSIAIGNLNQSAADAFGRASTARAVSGVASSIFGVISSTPAAQKMTYDFFNPKPIGATTSANSQGFVGPPTP